ncbi:MAG: hypothetical protein AAF581_20865 [Planctomycetota bacterium]
MGVVLVVACGPLLGQELRHEVGLRLRPLEREWAAAGPEARERVLPHMERAVRAFFGLNAAGVARSFDVARLRLEGSSGPPRWFDALSVQPTPRVLEPEAALSLRITSIYETSDRWPEASVLLATGRGPTGELVAFRLSRPGSIKPRSVELPWKLSVGDWTLTFLLRSGGQPLRTWQDTITVCEDARGRIATLRTRIAAQAKTSDPKLAVQRATADVLLTRCEQVVGGLVPEQPFGIDAALTRITQLISAVESQRFAGLGHGEQWWVVPRGAKRARLRLWIPRPLNRGSRSSVNPPLVVAVHGLGGSENLFFEGYGNGEIVKLCRERGWALVAPRQPLFGGMPIHHLLEELAPLVAFDPDRVLIVGHSKGAGETLGAVQATKAPFLAAALIGGGGVVFDAAAARRTPFWVATGASDFGRGIAERTHQALVRAGASSEWHIIPHTEHMTAVAGALPGVFEFFDRQLPPTRPALRRERF